MAKLIDTATATRIRADLKIAGDGLVTDRTDALARALELLLKALEAMK
jgi:hypothetical protein